MTKRLLSVAIAILMVLAIVPMSVFAAEADAGNTVILTAEPLVESITDPQVGDRFKVAFTVNEGTGMWSGQIYCRFDNRYITTVGYDTEGDDTLTVAINDMHDEGEGADSNSLVVLGSPDVNYAGGTGNAPVGEEGETYSVFLWYSGSFEGSDGIYEGGTLCIVEYEWIAVPEADMDLEFHVVPVNVNCDSMGTVPYSDVQAVDATVPVHVSGPVERTIEFKTLALAPNTASGDPVEAVTISDIKVGDFVWVYLYVGTPEGGNWCSFHGYIDFDEDIFDATANSSNTTQNFLQRIISTNLNAGNYTSDLPGGTPARDSDTLIPGNHVSNLLYAIQTFTPFSNGYGFPGVTLNGYLCRIRYTVKDGFSLANLKTDENGTYTEMTFAIYEGDAKYYDITDTSPEHQLVDSDTKTFDPANIIIENCKIYIETAAPAEYTVTFVDGLTGEVIDTQTVAEGGAATAPNAPAHEGYTFTGWDTDFSNVTGNLTVTAQYSINTYTVTFVDYDGTTLKEETVEYGGAATAPADPTREGYTFTGWDPADFSNVTEDMTITAQYTINSYTVTFVDWDGTVLKTETVEYGGAATAPADPTREGYTFTGWDVAFNNITGDLTVTAQYTINSYTITINYYRWSDTLEMWVAAQTAKTITVTYGAEYDVNDQIPAAIGDYIFDHADGELTGTVTGNITIDTYYVMPYEPVPPTVASTRVELRERATADAKKDVRFVFTVTFNDSQINYNNELVGNADYFEITALGATITVGSKSVNIAAKNIWQMNDADFEFTAVVSGITEKNWATTMTAVPYMTYTDGQNVTTVTGDAIEATVNGLINGD